MSAGGRPRHSLLVRLLAVSVLIAASAIAATTWLVMTSTTAAIRQQQGQSINADVHIYDALLGYAAQHRRWRGVTPLIDSLAEQTDRRIVLTTRRRRILAARGRIVSLPAEPSATVDALAVDPVLDPSAGRDGIDPEATGPFRHASRARASTGSAFRLRKAVGQLQALTEQCLRQTGGERNPDLSLVHGWVPVSLLAARDPRVARCFAQARRAQLRRWVAPPALLFINAPSASAFTSLRLTAAHRTRIILVALAILLLTLLTSALAARRLVSPLRALTAAAGRMADGATSVRVRARGEDELGRLGLAFNRMASRREQLEAQRTAMVNDIAHELRTPVSNVRGWLEAVQDGLAQPDEPLIDSLLDEARLLAHIIDDLRDLSAAEAGELPLHREALDARDQLEHALVAQRAAAERAQVHTTITAERGLAVCADPIRLRQALANLLSNAIRHTPPGGTITLRARRENDTITFEVHNTGQELPSEDLEKIFDRFWRADKSRSRRAGGSGLGLPIVRRLAEAHGGTVTAQSQSGHGTTLTLRLPAVHGQDHRGATDTATAQQL